MRLITKLVFGRRSLDSILSVIAKIEGRLHHFIEQSEEELEEIDTMMDRLGKEKRNIQSDIDRATRTHTRLADLIS